MRDAKRRAIIFTSLAILLAIIAGFLFMKQVGEVNNQLGKRTTVYVADTSITSREPLKQTDFTSREIPEKFLTDGAVKNIDNIDQFVSVVPMSEGEQLNMNLLKSAIELTSEDSRAVTLAHSDRILFDGSLETNDLVDIIVSHEKGDGYEETETTIFMRDIPVLGVSKGEDGLEAIGVELDLDDAKKLIHEINFAHSIRILKSSQGHSESEPSETEEEADEKGEEDKKEDEEEEDNDEKEDKKDDK